jgi:hypothetical protein
MTTYVGVLPDANYWLQNSTTEGQQQRARLLICGQAHSTAEAAEFLSMLGLDDLPRAVTE